jgi:hypothetical protein
MKLWEQVEDNEEWDILRRDLQGEARQRGLLRGDVAHIGNTILS